MTHKQCGRPVYGLLVYWSPAQPDELRSKLNLRRLKTFKGVLIKDNSQLRHSRPF